MGLDAVVYRNIRNLHLGRDAKLAQLEAETGQVYFLDPEIEKRHRDKLQALRFRLGNMAMISSLREEIGARMGADSIVQSKILYSGTHSGDCIPLRLMDRLSGELSLLRQRKDLSVEARNFLDCFQELVRVALREQNPIVF